MYISEVLKDSDKIRRVRRIETAWHSVWLRALEWECLLEHTGREEAKEGIQLQSESSNIEEDILKPTKNSTQLVYCEKSTLSRGDLKQHRV